MPIVRMPDERLVRFPDDMPKEKIKAFINEKFPQTQQKPVQLTPQQMDDVEQKALELRKNNGWDTSGISVAKDALKGALKGGLVGAERVANGASFGLYDWTGNKVANKTGQEWLNPRTRKKELEKDSGLIKVANIGFDIAGSIPTGGAIYKGVFGGLKAVPKAGKALKYLAPEVTGATLGGAYSGFENDSLSSAGYGAALGGLTAGVFDLGSRGLSRVFSAAGKVKNVPRGFEHAAGTKEGSRILNRAVRESDKIADEVYGKAPEALEKLNARAMDKLDDAVRGGVDVKGRIASTKQAYGNFIEQNSGKQIIGNPEVTRYVEPDGKYTPILKSIKRHMEKTTPDFKLAKKDGNIDYTHFLKDSQRREYIGTLPSTYNNPNEVFTGVNKGQARKYLYSKYNNSQKGIDVHDLLVKSDDGTLINKFAREGRKGDDYIKGLRRTSVGGHTLKQTLTGNTPLSNLRHTNNISQNTGNVKQNLSASDLGIKGLTENQQNWLNQAWTAGKKNTLEKAGSLGHLDEMSKELNRMVQASRLSNPNGVGTIATPETVALQGLKDKVDDIITGAGLKGIKAQYAKAKSLEDAYNIGLKFNPNSVKTRNLNFKTPEDRSAFAQGLIEQIKMNPDSKNIAGKARDLRGALRVALGDKAESVFKETDSINKAYKNVEKILRNAERKMSVPEPITGKVGLLRELIESPGSLVGGTADTIHRWTTAKSAERAAKYLLNADKAVKKPLRELLAPYLPSVAGNTSGSLIKLMKGE